MGTVLGEDMPRFFFFFIKVIANAERTVSGDSDIRVPSQSDCSCVVPPPGPEGTRLEPLGDSSMSLPDTEACVTVSWAAGCPGHRLSQAPAGNTWTSGDRVICQKHCGP